MFQFDKCVLIWLVIDIRNFVEWNLMNDWTASIMSISSEESRLQQVQSNGSAILSERLQFNCALNCFLVRILHRHTSISATHIFLICKTAVTESWISHRTLCYFLRFPFISMYKYSWVWSRCAASMCLLSRMSFITIMQIMREQIQIQWLCIFNELHTYATGCACLCTWLRFFLCRHSTFVDRKIGVSVVVFFCFNSLALMKFWNFYINVHWVINFGGFYTRSGIMDSRERKVEPLMQNTM